MKIFELVEMTSPIGMDSHFKKMSSLNKIIVLVLFFLPLNYSQQIDFQSPQNVKLFADFLFCDNDYLRAIEEYEKYLTSNEEDSVQFKIALSYSFMNDQANALRKMNTIKISSPFYEQSRMERLKSFFLLKIDSSFYSYADELINSSSINSSRANRLKNTSLLLISDDLPEKVNFLVPFENEDKNTLSGFYDFKKNPLYKSETLAGILSAVVPGAGKMYTKNYADGITAFLFTGLLTYLAYTNFDHNHRVRAWIFTSLGAGFYAGNVYGSIASAQIFNAKINFEFDEGVKLFLEEKNYFTPTYDFCK